MIKSLDLKNTLIDENGEEYLDLSVPSFNYKTLLIHDFFFVSEFEEMRIDSISYKYFSTMKNIDAIMVVNNITNPFSIKSGDMLIIPDIDESCYNKPDIVKDVAERNGTKPIQKQYNQIDENRERRLKNLTKESKSSIAIEQHKPNELTSTQVVKRYVNGKVILGTNLNTK